MRKINELLCDILAPFYALYMIILYIIFYIKEKLNVFR